MGLFDKYFRFLVRFKWAVIVFWLACLGVGIGIGPKFLAYVSINVSPPAGTPGHAAKATFDSLYEDKSHAQTYVFYLECGQCSTAVTPEMYRYADDVLSAAQNWRGGFVQSVQSYWTYPNGSSVQSRFLSTSNPRAMLALATTNDESDTEKLAEYVKHLRDSIKAIALEDGDYVGVVGGTTILVDSIKETTTSVTLIDSIVLPLALGVLVYVVQSWRFLIIPIVNVGTCLLLSFAIMYGVTHVTAKAPSFVPSVMEAMVIALSIDYSLFLLTRFRFESLTRRRAPMEAVREALIHAGEVVLMSGITLVCCFLGMIGFPSQSVYMVGVGCSICLTLAIVINLSMTPALLLAFPRFFSRFQFCPFCSKTEEVQAEGPNEALDDWPPSRNTAVNAVRESAPNGENTEESMKRSYFYRSTKWFIRWPYVLLTVLVPLALIAPAAVQIFDMDVSINANQICPRKSDSAKVLDLVNDNFPPGFLNPLYVIVDGGEDNALHHNAFFDAVNTLSSLLVNQTALSTDDVTSIAELEGQRLNWDSAQAILKTVPQYRSFYHANIDGRNASTLVTLVTPFEPWGDQISDFNDAVLDAFDDPRLKASGLQFYLGGAPIWMVNASRKTIELFPWIIVATVGAIFLIISATFRSTFIPLRYAFTLVFPLGFIFGVAVLFYQKGALNGLGIDALRGTNGLYWLTPIIAFPICTGLALDYDIFLTCRIYEYRLEGYTTDASILKAVHETASIITAAGVIMAIAFGGLLFSSIDTLNQLAWILFSSVLFDTFVVRTILVPAVVSMSKNVQWWPRKVPQNDLKDEFGSRALPSGYAPIGDDDSQYDRDMKQERGSWVADDDGD